MVLKRNITAFKNYCKLFLLMRENSFANRLIRARAAKGLSQGALAESAGIAAPQISRYERGTSVPRPHIAAKLANVLGVSDEWLGHGEGTEPGDTTDTVADEIENLRQENEQLKRWLEMKEAEVAAFQGMLEMLGSLYLSLHARLPVDGQKDPALHAPLRFVQTLASEKHRGEGIKRLYAAKDPATAEVVGKFKTVLDETLGKAAGYGKPAPKKDRSGTKKKP